MTCVTSSISMKRRNRRCRCSFGINYGAAISLSSGRHREPHPERERAMPHLHWARPHLCHICTLQRTGNGLAPSHSCTGAALTSATSAPGLGPTLPRLHRNWVRRCHICTGTGLAAATLGMCSPLPPAPGLGSPPAASAPRPLHALPATVRRAHRRARVRAPLHAPMCMRSTRAHEEQPAGRHTHAHAHAHVHTQPARHLLSSIVLSELHNEAVISVGHDSGAAGCTGAAWSRVCALQVTGNGTVGSSPDLFLNGVCDTKAVILALAPWRWGRGAPSERASHDATLALSRRVLST